MMSPTGQVPDWAAIRDTSEAMRDPTRGNVEALIREFDEYVWRFEASGLVTGPGIYFHERAIQRRRGHRDAASLLADSLFLEYVYAVLPSWGLHQAGSSQAKVTEFSLLAASLRAAAPLIEGLWRLNITTLAPEHVPEVSMQLWRVISAVSGGGPELRIAVGSSIVHHLLPDLVPPVGEEYASRFFAVQETADYDHGQAFLRWFPYLVEIGHRCGGAIGATINRGGYLATSPAKIIDNAITGFIQSRYSQPYA